MRKNKWIKIMAFLALFWIIIWIIWTGLLIIFESINNNVEIELTPEKLQQIEKISNSGSLVEWIWSWKLEK